MLTDWMDAELKIRDKVVEIAKDDPFSFNPMTLEDASSENLGRLREQNKPFWLFHVEYASSTRVGPSLVSPTRFFGDLHIVYFTKEPSHVLDYKYLDQMSSHFYEKTIDSIRFRTFFPYPASMDNGFTTYMAVIDFEFELYRKMRLTYGD